MEPHATGRPMKLGREEGISQVVGIILMVVVSVILASIVGSIGYQLAGNSLSSRTVAATAAQDGTNVIVTWQGGPDNDKVSSYDISIDGVLRASDLPPVTGSYSIISVSNPGAVRHVVVTATFIDGGQTVILNTYL